MHFSRLGEHLASLRCDHDSIIYTPNLKKLYFYLEEKKLNSFDAIDTFNFELCVSLPPKSKPLRLSVEVATNMISSIQIF